MMTQRIYAAHPITSYGTTHARRCLGHVRTLLPGVEVIDPEALPWGTDQQWLAEWPGVVADLDLLVVFADETGTIGTGCLREITDAVAHAVPVALLDPSGPDLHDLAGIDILPERVRSRQRAAVPSPGQAMRVSACDGAVLRATVPGESRAAHRTRRQP